MQDRDTEPDRPAARLETLQSGCELTVVDARFSAKS